jgi:hypothetical protein
MTIVRRNCRLDEDECARRCTGLDGGCDTLGDGLVSDGLATVCRGRSHRAEPDGSMTVLIDLVGVSHWDCECGCGWELTEAEAASGCPQEHPERCGGVLVRRQIPAHTDCPTCPTCKAPCGSRCLSDGREGPGPGRLRCVSCGHEWRASDAELVQAVAADQAWAQKQAREERHRV